MSHVRGDHRCQRREEPQSQPDHQGRGREGGQYTRGGGYLISHRPNNYKDTSQITRGGAEREASTPEEEVI